MEHMHTFRAQRLLDPGRGERPGDAHGLVRALAQCGDFVCHFEPAARHRSELTENDVDAGISRDRVEHLTETREPLVLIEHLRRQVDRIVDGCDGRHDRLERSARFVR
jgi:hypothetical protein